MTNTTETLLQVSKAPAVFAKRYLDHLCGILRTLYIKAIEAFIDVLLKAREPRNTIFFLEMEEVQQLLAILQMIFLLALVAQVSHLGQ